MLNNWILDDMKEKNRTIEDKQAQITDAKSEIGRFDAAKK